MGRVAREDNKAGVATATVTAGGKTLGSFDGNKTLVLNTKDLQAGNVQLAANGKGKLYYFWNSEGLSSDGKVKEEDSFLKVRRTLYDRSGRAIGNKVSQNDLVVVKLTVQSTGGSNVPNVVVSDLLPAGFEIENPRITNSPEMAWIKDATTPEHLDIRDDRIHMFTYATREPKSYYYTVRAVSPGVFKQGPASADAMYNGEYHSYHGSGTVVVARR